MSALFAFTLLIGAFLTFLVEPMVAKMILPLYGGSPAVWNTCMVFFQVSLLAGYAYAHFTPGPVGLRRHAGLHLLLMLLPFLVLPLSVSASWAPPLEAPPAVWLLAMLVAGVGLPFFVIAATALAQQPVRRHRAPLRGRSVFSLWRQQPRQHGRPALLPVCRRAAARPDPAEPALDWRLRATGHPHGRLRRLSVARPAEPCPSGPRATTPRNTQHPPPTTHHPPPFLPPAAGSCSPSSPPA